MEDEVSLLRYLKTVVSTEQRRWFLALLGINLGTFVSFLYLRLYEPTRLVVVRDVLFLIYLATLFGFYNIERQVFRKGIMIREFRFIKTYAHFTIYFGIVFALFLLSFNLVYQDFFLAIGSALFLIFLFVMLRYHGILEDKYLTDNGSEETLTERVLPRGKLKT